MGRWLELEQPDQTALASREGSEGLNARLGVDAIAGRRVWDVESTFEVAVGPLSAIDFRSRLPGTERSRTWPCWLPLITILLMATTITPPRAPTDDKVPAAVEKLLDDGDIEDDLLGFHAQQAAEKMLKALLAFRGVDYPKTHNLRVLVELLSAEGIRLPETLAEIDRLTQFRTTFRYDSISIADGRGRVLWLG